MVQLTDDTGAAVRLPPGKAFNVSRIVSLVPSLTEALALSCPGRLVGATDWCTHPADLVVTRIRGTKNPDLEAISALSWPTRRRIVRLTSTSCAGRGLLCGSPIFAPWTRR